MNLLDARKESLVDQSELNRAKLFNDWLRLTRDVTAITHKAKTVGMVASVGASLISGARWLWRKRASKQAHNTPLLQTLLQGAQLAGSLWSELNRSRTQGSPADSSKERTPTGSQGRG